MLRPSPPQIPFSLGLLTNPLTNNHPKFPTQAITNPIRRLRRLLYIFLPQRPTSLLTYPR